MLKRILIVDDDGALSEVLRDKLVIEGFSVQCAMDADEALRTSESFMPDLVSGNTNAAIIMIAEKASDMILQDAR